MSGIIITAEVEDSTEWESSFRTHEALFREYTATAVQFTATDSNEVAIHWEVEDVARFLELVDSQATVEAMEADGVKRDTVKLFVLDKALDL